MEPQVVYEDEFATIVFGHQPAALGHLKVFPKQKVKSIEELSSKQIAHLFTLATRCASLLFDGLQAQGTNIILNDGKNANQVDDNICIDVIARTEGDGLKFNWEFKQGDYEQVKQTASEIASKVVVYEKPAEIVSSVEKREVSLPVEKLEKKPVVVSETSEVKVVKEEMKKEDSKREEKPEGHKVAQDEPEKSLLYYHLMRMP